MPGGEAKAGDLFGLIKCPARPVPRQSGQCKKRLLTRSYFHSLLFSQCPVLGICRSSGIADIQESGPQRLICTMYVIPQSIARHQIEEGFPALLSIFTWELKNPSSPASAKSKTPKSLGWNSGLISEALSRKSNVLPWWRRLGERDIQDRTRGKRN